MESSTEKTSMPEKLLDGMKVLSFCHYLQGPAGVQYLADMGADVIRVEPLDGGFERRMGGPSSLPSHVSALFIAANRNKRSIAVNLKAPEGRRIVQRLVEEYDIVVENYRHGVMERLGLAYADLKAVQPDIIYASGSGFGAGGPMAKAPGQDLLIQAATGLVAASGNFGAAPTAAGASVVDQHAASLLAMGILGAFVRRLTTGRGGRVESNLFSAGIDLQMEAITFYLNRKKMPFASDLERDSHLATWFHPAPYGIYRIADGFIVLSLVSGEELHAALEDPALAALSGLDPFDDRDRYAGIVAQVLEGFGYAEIAPRLEAKGIWFARVATYEDLETHPQVHHNRSFADIEFKHRSMRVVAHPIRYDGEVPGIRRPPPELGANTREVLEQIGYSAGEIGDLAARRVVFFGETAGDEESSEDVEVH